MLLRPRCGLLGMVSLPYAVLSLLVPLLFLPVSVIAAVTCLAAGTIATFVAIVHLIVSVISVTAIAIARENWWHQMVVPIYRRSTNPCARI
jgi:hypothetical protein